MGILYFNKIAKAFFKQCLAADSPTKAPYNLSFDGSLFLFSGLRKCTYGNSQAPEVIAENAFAYILNCAQQYESAKNIFFYIDGIKPSNKIHTQIARATHINFDRVAAMAKLVEIISERCPRIEIVRLQRGESEHEFFTRRDRTVANILLTSDTDLFHIAYDYSPESPADLAYFLKKGANESYPLSTLLEGSTTKMPKLVFSLLAFLLGSDYTPSSFTLSMVQSIFCLFNVFDSLSSENTIALQHIVTELIDYCQKFKAQEAWNQKNSHVATNIEDVYGMDDVKFVVFKLLQLLGTLKQKIKLFDTHVRKTMSFTLNRRIQRNTSMTKQDADTMTCQYLELLKWSVNYSLIGSNYVRYNEESIWPNNMDPFLLYSRILSVYYGHFEDCQPVDFAKLFVTVKVG